MNAKKISKLVADSAAFIRNAQMQVTSKIVLKPVFFFLHVIDDIVA
jgi:hypothetical protein